MEEKQYYLLPWYKRIWFTLLDKVKNYFHHYRFPWVKFTIFILVIVLLLTVVLIILQGAPEFPNRTAYDKTGFVEYKDLTETEKVIENDNYSFKMDYSTTYFELTDKRTSKVWTSTPSTLNKADTLIVYYSDTLGSPSSMGTYKYSIDYEEQKRYSIRLTDNSIEVLYQIGGKINIDYTDLPQVMSKERFENFLSVAEKYLETLAIDSEEYKTLKKNIKILKSTYSLNDKQGYYALTNGISMTDSYVNIVYNVFYKYCGYTEEDYILDALDNGVDVTKEYPTFEISIKYTLENDGLEVELVNDSIVDYEEAPLVYVDVLPYFASASLTDTGYALIPDGSGVILDFNNNRSYATNYEQRIYGSDLAKNSSTMSADINKISLAVYGRKVNDNGLINLIESGAELASIVSKNSTSGSPYNQTFYRYYNRETDKYVFSSLSGASDITSWTNDYNTESLIMKIMCCEEEGTYSEMAKLYQKYLLAEELLGTSDTTNSVVLDLTLIGGYLEKANLLGVPYYRVSPLTTASQVEEIVNELIEDEITNINVIYDGWSNEGIKSTYIGKLKYNNAIASKKQLISLNKTLESKDINFYPLVSVSSAYTNKYLSDSDTIKDMYGNECIRYQSDEATYLQDVTTRPLYTLTSTTYLETVEKLSKAFNKLEISNIGLSDFGSEMYGSYKNNDVIFRSETLSKYIETMEEYSTSFRNVMSSLPNDYALKYTTTAINIPTSGTNYQIVQASVPFYQLVVSGYIDYSSESFNMNDEYSFSYYKMKAIETGSNIALTWTYSKTTELIETEYDYLYSTYYKNWYDEAVSIYKEMNTLNIYSSSLNSHELLNNTGNVSKSTYSNGVEIVFNYSNENYTYNGIVISANNYKIVKEAAGSGN